MHNQSNRQLQERLTSLPVPEVLDAATRFFARQNGVYCAFVEKQGPTYVAMRGQGGEEVIIGARVTDDGVMVTGSTYLFDQQVARFLDSLAPVDRAASPAVAPVSEPATESLSATPTPGAAPAPMPKAPATGSNP